MSDDRNRCTATSKRSGERCRRHCRPGSPVCSIHGGKKASVMAAAVRRAELARVEEQVRRSMEDAEAAGGAPEPLTAAQALDELLKNVTLQVQWRDLLQERIRWLRDVRYSSDIGTEQIRGEVQLWERSLRMTQQALKDVADLRLDERKATLDKRQGELLASVMNRILDALDLSPEQRALVPVVVPREIRRASGGGA